MHNRRMILLAVALSLSGAVAAAQPNTVVTTPAWLQRPSGEDIARVYPEDAQLENLSGLVTIECKVSGDGRLADCRVAYEAPLGKGFGDAGLKLAPKFRMRTVSVDGAPVAGGTIRIPMRLELPGGTAPLATDFPGAPAFLIKPDKRGDVGCPTTADPARKCSRHLLQWAQRPDVEQLRAATAGKALPNATFLTCTAGADGALRTCGPSTNASQASAAAMLALTPFYRAPAAASDGVATSGGTVLMLFDWPAATKSLNLSTVASSQPGS